MGSHFDRHYLQFASANWELFDPGLHGIAYMVTIIRCMLAVAGLEWLHLVMTVSRFGSCAVRARQLNCSWALWQGGHCEAVARFTCVLHRPRIGSPTVPGLGRGA